MKTQGKPQHKEIIATETFPVRLISEANNFDHWTKKYKRKKNIQKMIWFYFINKCPSLVIPCEVHLTRYGKKLLDQDNLVHCFKSAIDQIASHIIPGLKPGQADSSIHISWHYHQEIAKFYAFKMEICK